LVRLDKVSLTAVMATVRAVVFNLGVDCLFSKVARACDKSIHNHFCNFCTACWCDMVVVATAMRRGCRWEERWRASLRWSVLGLGLGLAVQSAVRLAPEASHTVPYG